MYFSQNDLLEAERQINSILHKLQETIKTLEAKENKERYKSQVTLAEKRIKAFELTNYLIKKEINS